MCSLSFKIGVFHLCCSLNVLFLNLKIQTVMDESQIQDFEDLYLGK